MKRYWGIRLFTTLLFAASCLPALALFANSPTFHVEARKDLLKRTYYVVVFNYPGLPPAVVVEVRTAVGKLTAEQRANIMAARMRELQHQNPNWAKKTLIRRTKDGQWVVAVRDASQASWIATADPRSVKAMKCQDTHDLAQKMKQNIESKVTPKIEYIVPAGKFRAEATPKMPVKTAQDYVSDGDTCRTKGDIDGAIDAYQMAIKLDKDYVQAKLALALIYTDLPDRLKDARKLLSEVSKSKDLDSDQKQVLEMLQQKLQQ